MSTLSVYATRLMPPYSGVVQVVEGDKARAVSMDGKHWEIQAWHESTEGLFSQRSQQPSVKKHYRVARYTLEDGIYKYPLYPTLDPNEIYASCMPVIKHIAELDLPLKIRDDYEYWLVDEKEQKPLALIGSSHSAGNLRNVPPRPDWRALSSMQLDLKSTPEEVEQGLSPPSDRLEKLVRKKAGINPKAFWYKRAANGDAEQLVDGSIIPETIESYWFPEFLIREDWETEEDNSVCYRYLERISPRLLILQRLTHAGRERAEIMARSFALEVERYHKLYPEVVNEELMVTMRVEARLRRSMSNQQAC